MMCETVHYGLKHQQLLRDLKTTVEGLLVSQVANVWHIYGGLNRLHNSLDKIFRHGSIETGSYLKFVQGLEWLQPETANLYFSIDCEYKSHFPAHIKDDKASIWLYRSLENHTLSQKLSWLLSDKTHLHNSYQQYAFLAQEKYAEATLICLRAVERNQASLMSEINPCLFLYQANAKEFHKLHRRCSSFPDNYVESGVKVLSPLDSHPEQPAQVTNLVGKLKPWSSMPSLQTQKLKIVSSAVSKTTPSTPVHTKKKISSPTLKLEYKTLPLKLKKSNLKKTTSRRKEMRHVIINNYDIVEHTPTLSSSQSSEAQVNDELANLSTKSMPARTMKLSPRLMENFLQLPRPGEKDFKRNPKKSFIEDGGLSVLPMATGYFPRPQKGQSLQSFLTSGQFARANAELDRENAHFSISEAIIAAMEQIKCKRDMKLSDEQLDESDPEIMDLKQRIRMRRREKLVEKQKRLWAESLLSDGKADTTTSVSPCSTTPDSLSITSSDVDDFEIDETSNITDNKGLSISMASLYSEADLFKRPVRGAPDGASDIFSAEGVALSLISKFSERQLPRASDLEWLVSEEETHQALLPLPNSWPVSPDDSEGCQTPLRGTQEWAPPRPQIIFTYHPTPCQKSLMIKQNYRCAGCSMKVMPQYSSRYRYCNYIGRYFCTGCHTNQLAIIPGRILQKWDFTRYPVSTFSYRLLEQMYTDPLFRICELNKNILKMSKNLRISRNYRLGLNHLKDFITTCRFAEKEKHLLQMEKPYIYMDPEVYSLEDLVSIRNGDMKNKLKHLVDTCCQHTSECTLCLARGFICEICHLNEVIFPWQMKIVQRCNACGVCYHAKCWNPTKSPCSKCDRIRKRRYD